MIPQTAFKISRSRLSEVSIRAAIALENAIERGTGSDVPIRALLEALEVNQSNGEDRICALSGDYRRVGLYNQAWRDATGTTLETLGDLASEIGALLGKISESLETVSRSELIKAREFCVALNRAAVNAEYERARDVRFPIPNQSQP